ncbi:hypothetical protein C8R48DRAFT_668604 [Suillus tomentosus]|nr:hypothetical protein C8R48DRAFT_668604 [Suillus tomentosus]
MCDHFLLKERDRDALHKFVAYVMGMPCVRLTSSPTSLLSADVTRPLIDFIKPPFYVWHGIEVNGVRLRDRLLNKDPTKPFNIDTHNIKLGVPVLESYEDPFTQSSPTFLQCPSQRQASPSPLDDNIEILDDLLNSGSHDVCTNNDDLVTPCPPMLPLTKDNCSSDGPSGTTETDQGPTQATISSMAGSTVSPQSSAIATVASEAQDDDAGGILAGTILPLTPSPDGLPHGFGTNDTSWYDPNARDDDQDHDMQEHLSSSKEYIEDEDTRSTSRASEVDDPHDKMYVPTQLLTQECLPPHNKGASLSSFTHECGRKNKKKAKVNVQSLDDEDDKTIVPGI